MTPQLQVSSDSLLTLGGHTFGSRLIVGTGKYESYEIMEVALVSSGA